MNDDTRDIVQRGDINIQREMQFSRPRSCSRDRSRQEFGDLGREASVSVVFETD